MKTTDNLQELFDIVDLKDNIIGHVRRGEVHGNPKLIHRSVAVAVFNNKGEIFLQQRSATKDTDPLLWTISCSGHVGAGDSYEHTAFRELEEELGIVGVPITLVTKFLYHSPIETEIAVLYKTVWDGKLKLQAKETKEGRFFTQKTLSEALLKREVMLSSYGQISLVKLGWIGMRKGK